MSRSIFLTLIAFSIQSGMVFGQQVKLAQQKPKALTMRMLLDDGWRISSHTIYQFMVDSGYQSNNELMHKYMKPAAEPTASFVVEKAGKFKLCWGNERLGYDNPCRLLN